MVVRCSNLNCCNRIIIYVATNFYSNRLRTSLGEIDRVYLDGVISLSLLDFFLTRRTIKFEQPLSATEIRSLFTYVELLLGGIYCTLDNKFNEITTKVPIKRLKRNLQSASTIDPICWRNMCIPKKKYRIEYYSSINRYSTSTYKFSWYYGKDVYVESQEKVQGLIALDIILQIWNVLRAICLQWNTQYQIQTQTHR